MARPDEAFRKRELEWIQSVFIDASAKGFFGNIIVKMENGRVRRVVREESIKPPSDSPSS